MIDSVDAINEICKEADSLENGLSLAENIKMEELDDPQAVGKGSEADFPSDDDIFDMIKDVKINEPLPTVTERYFTRYYRINFPKKGDDICIRMHTNRLCMISLAPSHAIFDGDRKIEKIDFQVTDKLNRAANAVSGKAKHGAQPMHETSKICTITCSDGQSWIVRCGMNGKLTEANTDLIDNPALLRQPPHKGGYLAIVLPKLDAPEKMKQYLMTQEAYDAAMRDRSRGDVDDCAAKRPRDDETLPVDFKEKIMKTTDDRRAISTNVDASELSCT